MHQILLAVNHCHSKGIYLRNIGIENIMITEDDDVNLTDFFNAKVGKAK